MSVPFKVSNERMVAYLYDLHFDHSVKDMFGDFSCRQIKRNNH